MRRSAVPPAVAAIAALASLWLAGCATAPPPPPPGDPLPAGLRAWLLAPTTAETVAAAPGAAQALRLHRRLLETGDGAAVAAAAANLAAAAPELAAARVVLAQARLVAGEAEAALAAARAAGEAGGVPARAVEARALESIGDLPGAWEIDAALAAALPLAAASADRLGPRAAEILERRIAAALERADVAGAERELSRLERLRPHAATTLGLAAALARVQGDAPRELALLRSLVAAAPARTDLQLRRAQLELEVGDPRTGLDLVQALAAAAPADAALAEELRRARFRWRVLNAPEAVRRAAAMPQVSRADLAVLLYWLVPQVRTARGGAPRIASDVLEHPAQEEIVRVVNLGLLSVDETLHRFEPDRPARRAELLRALLRLIAAADPGGCAAGAGASRDEICRGAASCGLTPSAEDCLPGGALAGTEALEAVRRAVERLERP